MLRVMINNKNGPSIPLRCKVASLSLIRRYPKALSSTSGWMKKAMPATLFLVPITINRHFSAVMESWVPDHRTSCRQKIWTFSLRPITVSIERAPVPLMDSTLQLHKLRNVAVSFLPPTLIYCRNAGVLVYLELSGLAASAQMVPCWISSAELAVCWMVLKRVLLLLVLYW